MVAFWVNPHKANTLRPILVYSIAGTGVIGKRRRGREVVRKRFKLQACFREAIVGNVRGEMGRDD